MEKMVHSSNCYILLFGTGFSYWNNGRKRKIFFSLSEYAVGDRSFNLFIMWFLMGGTIFFCLCFLGGPGWAFSKGAASFYILVYCTLGLMPWYVIGPKFF